MQGGLASATCTFDGTTAPGNTATLKTTTSIWLTTLKTIVALRLTKNQATHWVHERVYQRKI